MSRSNFINNVAVVGAGGHSGKFMTQELLKTGKHNVTAITRADSQSKLPEGVSVKKVDYSQQSSLVEALKGQDALVITLGGRAPPDTQLSLIEAASEAGVAWILPNEWAPDTANEDLRKAMPAFARMKDIRDHIASISNLSYVAVATGYWYEWMLAIPVTFGFDFANRAVTFFDEGETKICVSTWPQVGRAVAALLSLPIAPEGGNSRRCLQHLRNQLVYINSFTVSQNDMLESALRVTGIKYEEWKITKEPAQVRYQQGLEEVQKGNMMGFAKMTARVFYPDDVADYEKNKGTINDLLGLPKEEIDEATERAIERSKGPLWS